MHLPEHIYNHILVVLYNQYNMIQIVDVFCIYNFTAPTLWLPSPAHQGTPEEMERPDSPGSEDSRGYRGEVV